MKMLVTDRARYIGSILVEDLLDQSCSVVAETIIEFFHDRSSKVVGE